ncbi:asparagine synthase-related protein [Bacillus alkalicellulosilyticus]|uniref:asparagine synthase-related protein n=1 Tax=Alkalihalobacterium alkalicellulosilyticum TaxID=1912214 RepID=UPI00099616CF|nr:asparagine synthase-related protein [Bacillus alkalicellulosilyticus]
MSAIAGIMNVNKEILHPSHKKLFLDGFQQFPSSSKETWQGDNMFLYCHHQCITPESIGEQLPYHDYERQLVITADAILDNRDELIVKLNISKKYEKLITDSKLILLAYDKWKDECPKHLLGDFAFMIWDEKEQKLFGARDFSGARTLYYFNNPEHFAFSTIIEPLFTLPYVNKQLNEEWLAEFLAIPTMVESVSMETTVYKNVMQLPPSHSITVQNGKVSISRYLTLEVNEPLRFGSNDEYEEAFREVLQRAVKERLRTHGKVGSHLSGGLDSGSVVSFAAQELKKKGQKLHTFSYIPEDSFEDWTPYYYQADERPYVKETVRHVGNIKDHYLDFAGKSPLSEIDDFLDIMEMPYKFFENAYWLNGINEYAQKQGVKVLLNGARGNHSISWGSWNMTMNYYGNLLKKLKWIQLNSELNFYCRNFRTGKRVMLPQVVKKAFPNAINMFQKQISTPYQFPAFIEPSFANRTKVYEKLKAYDDIGLHGGTVNNLQEYRMKYYQQLYPWNKSGTANTKLSLRYGMWDRDPTNDLSVIKFCLAVPEEQYVVGGLERSLIRRSMKGWLPEKVRLNQVVRGIQGADTIHRMSSQWKNFIHELESTVHNPIITEFIDKNVIKQSIERIKAEPKPELVFDDDFKILTRTLIVSRFIKQFH